MKMKGIRLSTRLLLICFFSAGPAIAQEAEVKLFAHRGGSYEFDENTLEARPLRYLKSTYPGVDLLFIKSEGLSESLIAELKELGVTRIGCRLGGTTREMVEAAREQGITVSLWPGHTINDFLLGVFLGADYLCSDIPVEVSNWVKENQPWITLKQESR